MVDKTLVLRKLAELDQYLSQVKEYAGISIEQYESSWKTQRIIERTLQMMIETCVDIAGHYFRSCLPNPHKLFGHVQNTS